MAAMWSLLVDPPPVVQVVKAAVCFFRVVKARHRAASSVCVRGPPRRLLKVGPSIFAPVTLGQHRAPCSWAVAIVHRDVLERW